MTAQDITIKTMYRTTSYNTKIDRHTVTRTTKKRVTLQETSWRGKPFERTEALTSCGHQWHETWESARVFLETRARDRLDTAQMNLDRARSELEQVRQMKEPAA
jgi:hypothetical protein